MLLLKKYKKTYEQLVSYVTLRSSSEHAFLPRTQYSSFLRGTYQWTNKAIEVHQPHKYTEIHSPLTSPIIWGLLNTDSIMNCNLTQQLRKILLPLLRDSKLKWSGAENSTSLCLAIKLIVVAMNGICEHWFTTMKWNIFSSKAKQNSNGLQRNHDSTTN